MAIATVSPATGETLRTFDPLGDQEIEEKLQRSVEAASVNRKRSFEDRAARMRKAADLLDQRQKEYGRLMTVEMGKPIKAAIGEANKCALVCRYYADHAKEFLADEAVKTEAERTFIRYEPIGPVLSVMPWNFPFWQVFRFAAPALMAGNVGLLKHSSNVPQCALAIEEVFRDAGFADGEFQTLLITSEQVAKILEDDRIKAATLTGSEPAGSNIASTAGKRVKKSVLELGGSDPFVVMPSANLEDAINTAVKARTINNGQSCIAAKRFIVHQKIADEFEKRFASAMEKLKIGDPLDESTEIGPLATPQIVKDIASQVERSVAAGARLLTGGKRIGERGNFYAPTVLTNVPRNAPAACEETFGPVAAIFRVRDAEEAIALANDTKFGLGASVWTRDRREADRFIDAIQSGQVFVNAMVASDPRVPFGGVKHSGFGRELGAHGIREFVNIKTVWIAKMDGGGASRSDATE